MNYRVRLQIGAEQDLDEAYHFAAQHAPQTAARWFNRFHEALRTLEHNPQRCPLAPEDRLTTRELRQFLFGKRPNVFRVIFTIEHDIVWILRIRRAARQLLSEEELGDQ